MLILAEPKTEPIHPQEWYQRRQSGIGGSESAAVLGLSKYHTPYEVWLRKVTPVEQQEQTDNDAMKAGRMFEPAIRQEYSSVTGFKIYDPGFASRDDIVCGNVDGLCEDRILEIKTTTNREWEEDDIPVDYYMQCQHYMYLFERQQADLCAYFLATRKLRVYNIVFNAELFADVLTLYKQFWDCVLERRSPELVSLSDINQSYRFSKSIKKELGADVIEHVEQYKAIKEQIAELEALKDEHELAIKKALEEADAGTDLQGNTLVTWKTSKPRVTLDSARLKSEAPEVYAQYSKEGKPTRVFLVK